MRRFTPVSCGECQSQLLDYIHGDLSPLQRRRVARHLSGCRGCATLYHAQKDVARDLSLVVPLIGAEQKPDLGRVWTAVQVSMAQPRQAAVLPARYGLALAVLFLMCLTPLTMVGNRYSPVPPTQPPPVVQRATPSSTAPGFAPTAVAFYFVTDDVQATPEAPQLTAGPVITP